MGLCFAVWGIIETNWFPISISGVNYGLCLGVFYIYEIELFCNIYLTLDYRPDRAGLWYSDFGINICLRKINGGLFRVARIGSQVILSSCYIFIKLFFGDWSKLLRIVGNSDSSFDLFSIDESSLTSVKKFLVRRLTGF